MHRIGLGIIPYAYRWRRLCRAAPRVASSVSISSSRAAGCARRRFPQRSTGPPRRETAGPSACFSVGNPPAISIGFLQVTATAVEDLFNLPAAPGVGGPTTRSSNSSVPSRILASRGSSSCDRWRKIDAAARLQPRQAAPLSQCARLPPCSSRRAGKQCRRRPATSLPQLIDHSFDALHRADNHAGEE